MTQRPVRDPVLAYSLMLGHQDWPGLDFPNSYKKLILNIPPGGQETRNVLASQISRLPTALFGLKKKCSVPGGGLGVTHPLPSRGAQLGQGGRGMGGARDVAPGTGGCISAPALAHRGTLRYSSPVPQCL